MIQQELDDIVSILSQEMDQLTTSTLILLQMRGANSKQCMDIQTSVIRCQILGLFSRVKGISQEKLDKLQNEIIADMQKYVDICINNK